MGDNKSNDESLQQKFRDKNRAILIENILRQIDENDNSLRLTLSNKISLISNEILRKINFSLKDSTAEYDFKAISDVFLNNEALLRKYIFEYVDKRRDEITNKSVVDEEFFEETFLAVIETFQLDNKHPFENRINEVIYSTMQNELFSKIRFSDEDQKQMVISYLNRFDFKLTTAVEDSVDDRNNSLKNLVLETHEKINDLNKQTAELAKSLVIDKAA